MIDFSQLGQAASFWNAWGFEPWRLEQMEGVYRRVTVKKGSILGEVARYYADDYIVFRHRGDVDRDWVYRTWRPAPDVMVHRFVFLEACAAARRTTRSFWLGFRGYVEVYQYTVKSTASARIRDLAPLIDRAWERAHERVEGREV